MMMFASRAFVTAAFPVLFLLSVSNGFTPSSHLPSVRCVARRHEQRKCELQLLSLDPEAASSTLLKQVFEVLPDVISRVSPGRDGEGGDDDDANGLTKLVGSKKKPTVIGIQTAQMLLDERKREKIKGDISRSFPFVPANVIDTLLEATSDAFQSIAPQELKLVLRPGWLDKNRAKFSQPMVESIMRKSFVRDVPVKSELKEQLVNKVVDFIIDQIISEADGLLTAPEVRLALLEEERNEIKSEMGRRRLFLYHLKKRPRTFATAAAFAAVLLIIVTDARRIAFTKKCIGFIASGLGWAFTVAQLFMQKTGYVLDDALWHIGDFASTVRTKFAR